MRFKKLFKIHYYYFFSKINIIIVSICFILIQLLHIVLWQQNLGNSVADEMIIDFVISSIFTIEKMILVFFSILMIGNFCLPEKDDYKVLYVYNEENVSKFYLTKFVTIDLFLLGFHFIVFIFFELLGMLYIKTFVVEIQHIKFFLYLYLIGVTYGHLTTIILKILPSNLTVFIVFILFLVSDVFNYNWIFNTFFPSLDLTLLKVENTHYDINLFIISLFYFVISIICQRGNNS
ncbi:MAG: hypothetical protein IKC22_03900 [Bacilli bacterium]|nr:hypothetical protein [Bacilli bacterium]